MSDPPSLSNKWTLAEGVLALSKCDPDLAGIVAHFGMPPLWVCDPGFPNLIAIILEQQVSLGSARAAVDRLLCVASPLTPERFLLLDNAALGACDFSRQKIAYGRELAEVVLGGRLDLGALDDKDDDAARSVLTGMKGLVYWSADVYLMMALRRLDIWPVGDWALAVAAQRVKNLALCPTSDDLERFGSDWHPRRSVVAPLLWHDYLSRRAAVSGQRFLGSAANEVKAGA